MRLPPQVAVFPSELTEFADDVTRIFRELGRPDDSESLAGECSPPIDVYETDETLEIVADLPGVAPADARVVVKGHTVLIVGEKRPRRTRGESSFHLVERGFGRFARAVRLLAPCDSRRARVSMTGGELRITLPKILERRGRPITIPIDNPETPRASQPGL